MSDTTAFMQFIQVDLFKISPIELIVPMAAVRRPSLGRYRGLAQNLNRPPLDEMMRNKRLFDTCVYHQPASICSPSSSPSTTPLCFEC